jgi:hypothetical protein
MTACMTVHGCALAHALRNVINCEMIGMSACTSSPSRTVHMLRHGRIYVAVQQRRKTAAAGEGAVVCCMCNQCWFAGVTVAEATQQPSIMPYGVTQPA